MSETEDIQAPYAGSYWVAPNKLLAGPYPGERDAAQLKQKAEALVEAGIDYVIDLMEDTEVDLTGQPFVSYIDAFQEAARAKGVQVQRVRLPIRDFSVPSRGTMRQVLDEIDHALDQHHRVLVHCWGGRGRTGTVIGCYLARHGIAVGQDALDRIQELRSTHAEPDDLSPETEWQREFVRSWQAGE